MNAQPETVSNQAEEYLEAIYRLEQKTGYARTMDLARSLNVVPGSITNTIENLERKGLVIHTPYKGVKLTENGRKIASNVLRRHRLAERLLTDILHLDWSQVHDPACKLEHALSPEILKPLEEALGHPKRCPHGNLIPTNYEISEEKTLALNELDAQTSGIVVKIIEEKAEVLQQLARLNIMPEKRVEVEAKDVSSGSLTIRVDGECLTISNELASIIHVKKAEGNVKN